MNELEERGVKCVLKRGKLNKLDLWMIPPDLYLDDVPSHGRVRTVACSTAGVCDNGPFPVTPLHVSFAQHCQLAPESTAA